jgi:hypothetical protein
MLRVKERSSASVLVQEAQEAPDVATAEHCVFCFDSLLASLHGAESPTPGFLDAHWYCCILPV